MGTETGDLEERLIADGDDSGDESDADEGEASPGSCYATTSQYLSDFWFHWITQTIFHTFRRLLVGGIKVSGTVAFMMYVHLIYLRVSLNSEIYDTERNALDSISISDLEQLAIEHLEYICEVLACVTGGPSMLSNLQSAFVNASRDQIVHLAPNITNLTKTVYQNVERLGIQAVVPAACVDVGIQAIVVENNTLAFFINYFAMTFVCQNTVTLPPPGYANLCLNCLDSTYANMTNGCMGVFDVFSPAHGKDLELLRRFHFFSIRSELYTQVMYRTRMGNTTSGIVETKEAAVGAVQSILNNHYGLFVDFLGGSTTSFSALPPAYRNMSELLIGIFIGFGILDAMMHISSRLNKQIRPYWYGFLQGVDSGLIKVLLLLTLFGHCDHPHRPSHEDFKAGDTLTFMNIPVCSQDISAITWWSLSWLVPVCLVAAYFEFNKFRSSKAFYKSHALFFPSVWALLRKRRSLLSQLGMGISTFTGLLALMDLLLNHLIPYGATLRGTGESGLNERNGMIIKLSLVIPVIAIGVYVERRYLRSKEQGLWLRKGLALYNEGCKLILFNYIALSFFFAFEYAEHWHAADAAGSDDDAVTHRDSLGLTAWQTFWVLLCLAAVGSAIVIHDEWFYKMRPEPKDDSSEDEVHELDDLASEGYAGPTMFAGSAGTDANLPAAHQETPC